MTDLFKKLNWKAPAEILVLHAPEAFGPEAGAQAAFATLVSGREPSKTYPFVLTFAETLAELGPRAEELLAAAAPGALLWIAYPKQTSKRYQSDLNRDVCWKYLAGYGLEPVRQVAIDDDWSAMRYKR